MSTNERDSSGRVVLLSSNTALAPLHEHADSFVGRGLRAAIAAVPILGGSISVLVESHLSALQAQRVDAMFNRLFELEQILITDSSRGDGIMSRPRYSEKLLERATIGAVNAPEADRAPIFANVIFCGTEAGDATEVVRSFLIDVCASLSQYEMALLVRIGGTENRGDASSYARRLMDFELSHPELDPIRQFSQSRLLTYHLITSIDNSPELTGIGRLLISVI